MDRNSNYLIVDTKVLPDVFPKVLEVKSLLAQGLAKNSSEACKMVGISRGAYYKYKDSLFPYEEQMNNEIVTFHLRLMDRPGVLSSVLACLYEQGANILTVNQNIPSDRVAVVTIAVRIDREQKSVEAFITALESIDGVVEIKQI